MPSTWTINGSTRDALGITRMTRQRQSLAVDVLTLTFDDDVTASAVFATDDVITVLRDGVTWFSGKVLPSKAASPGQHGGTLQVRGAWAELERTQFLHSRGSGNANISGRVTMFADAAGEPETTVATINRILDYAEGKGIITKGSGWTTGNMGSLTPAMETSQDRMCAEMLQSAMRFHWDCAAYISGEKTLNVKQRGDSPKTLAFSSIRDIDIRFRDDLIPAGVVIRYEDPEDAADEQGVREAVAVDAWPTDSDIGDPGVIALTVILAKGEAVPAGNVAKRWFQMISDVTIVEGSVTIEDEECGTGYVPGDTINVSGGNAAWAAMKAFVQGVIETPELGTTQLTFGLPGYLGVKEFADLLKTFHRMRQRDEDRAADETAITTEVPTTPLTAYAYYDNESAQWTFRVTPGVFSNGGVDPDVVPKWQYSSTPLDAAETPNALLSLGDSFNAWIYLELTPETEQVSLVDDAGDPFTEWRMTGLCTIEDLRVVFITGSPAARAASIDVETGDVDDTARVYLHWASVAWPLDAAEPSVSVIRSGSQGVEWVPPQRVYLHPESAS